MKGYSDTGGTSDNLLETGRLSYSSSYGLMLQNRDENNTVPSHSNTVPSHSIDSYGNDVDMVLLTFDTAVSLTRFGIGWACEFPNSQQSSCKQYSISKCTSRYYCGRLYRFRRFHYVKLCNLEFTGEQ